MQIRLALAAIALLYTVMCVSAIDWGLPSSQIDRYLFGTDEPWTGEKIYRLAGGASFGSADVGADVDVDPIRRGEGPVNLTETPEGVAAIYLRYRLYSHQPDEMIVLRALAGMRPRSLQFDPKLYQYGGLFIYPVGALMAVCGQLGWVTLTSDVVHYLDHPDQFGALYIVARGYAAAWGLVGVLAVYGIGRRLGSAATGCVAALLFVLMPVVVCMSHEGKPHLPGAVLMLICVWLAMRTVDQVAGGDDGSPLQSRLVRATLGRRAWWLMCGTCGAAIGMVLSSVPILILIPLIAAMRRQPSVAGEKRPWSAVVDTFVGLAIAGGVYLVTNPYVALNLLLNREVLASNFGNSTAMYELGRIGEGLRRVVELTVEGATIPIVVLGSVAAVAAVVRRSSASRPLLVAAACVAAQFVLLGAGKAAEYGRFGIFPNTALAIGTACILVRRWTALRASVNWIPTSLVVAAVGYIGWGYQYNFLVDRGPMNSRWQAAERAELGDNGHKGHKQFAVVDVPAPYCCPPANFARTAVWLLPDASSFRRADHDRLVYPVDTLSRIWRLSDPAAERMGAHRQVVDFFQGHPLWGLYGYGHMPTTPISWANKPIAVQRWNYDATDG